MRNVYRHLIISLIIVIAVGLTIVPPERKLKRDKDLAGGSTLVYQVDIRPTDPTDTINRVKDLISRRLDPNGVMGISLVVQGGNRIEITMPLPNEAMKRLKREFEEALTALGETSITSDKIDRAMGLTGDTRATELARLGGGDPARLKAFQDAAAAYDAVAAEMTKASDALRAIAERRAVAEQALEKARTENKDAPAIKTLQDDLAKIAEEEAMVSLPAARASRAYDETKKAALATVLTAPEVRRVLELSDIDPRFQNATGGYDSVPSPRKKAITRLKESHPGAAPQLDKVVERWNAYQKERSTLDDPADVRRLLKGAGVLDFRIAVTVGDHHPQEQELRKRLREAGPLAVQSGDARWFKINKVDTWFRSAGDFAAYEHDAEAFFRARGYVVDIFDGEPYMLCYDSPGMRLTQAEGNWSVASARRSVDQIGKPNIAFTMDALGASKLGDLTGPNKDKPMAVLLDDQVYTAPNLNSRISTDGQITGVESAEIDYIVRVLGAGSMAAKLSPDPVSESTVGPELGADNLQRGLKAGAIAFAMVAAFMVVYYFGCGMIAVVVLVVNAVMILGIMALCHAAFSLPGIAGVVLTFGQAVDANVLIYERMREELGRGYDLRNAARLGFSRALSPIVDGNISNLIICAMLGFFGTQEVRGFAITLSIGILTTLFCTLYITRLLFVLFIEKFHWRNSSQLPIAFPFVQRLMHPTVDWMKHRWGHLAILIIFLSAAGAVAYHQGSNLLGTEFRGGTAVTLTFKQTAPSTPGGKPTQMKLARAQVQARVKELAEKAPADSPLKRLEDAQIIAVNPDADNVTSSTFTVKTRLTDPQLVQSSIAAAFGDVIESRPQLRFTGSEVQSGAATPVYPLIDTVVGKSINRAAINTPSGEFYGGTAVVVDNIEPAPTLKDLEDRVRRAREKSGMSEVASRVLLVDGTDQAVKTAVIVSKDPSVSYFEDPKVWEAGPREREWTLIHTALTESQTLASVQAFSPAIARTFAMQGLVCTALSLILLTLYVFIRFGTLRWALAATLPLFADVIGIVGLLALAQLLYENPTTHGFAASIGLLPFEVDLAQIAAILTIVGYSLNDKIIILDRIRESKGRSPYASARVINDSINQTLSRTIITAGAHMITTIVLYCYGGEAVRGFAYTFNLGVLLGTYTSIVSTPLVWSRKSEATEASTPPSVPPSSRDLQPAT